jgi:hypothetical protein
MSPLLTSPTAAARAARMSTSGPGRSSASGRRAKGRRRPTEPPRRQPPVGLLPADCPDSTRRVTTAGSAPARQPPPTPRLRAIYAGNLFHFGRYAGAINGPKWLRPLSRTLGGDLDTNTIPTAHLPIGEGRGLAQFSSRLPPCSTVPVAALRSVEHATLNLGEGVSGLAASLSPPVAGLAGGAAASGVRA